MTEGNNGELSNSSSSSSNSSSRSSNSSSSSRQRSGSSEDDNDTSNRRLVEYSPMDFIQENSGSFNVLLGYKHITIAALESEDASRRRNPGLMKRYVDLQLLRIINGGTNGGMLLKFIYIYELLTMHYC